MEQLRAPARRTPRAGSGACAGRHSPCRRRGRSEAPRAGSARAPGGRPARGRKSSSDDVRKRLGEAVARRQRLADRAGRGASRARPSDTSMGKNRSSTEDSMTDRRPHDETSETPRIVGRLPASRTNSRNPCASGSCRAGHRPRVREMPGDQVERRKHPSARGRHNRSAETRRCMKPNRPPSFSPSLMCRASLAGLAARPARRPGRSARRLSLETAVPKAFGEWTELPEQSAQVVNPQTAGAARQALQPGPDPHLRQQGRLPDHAVDGLRRRPARRPAGAPARGLLSGAGLQARQGRGRRAADASATSRCAA